MASERVEVKQGALKGKVFTTENNFEYVAFLGVPYAKPPVGDLRFKAPQSPEQWEGERDATVVEEKNCPQINMISGSVSGSEDCLYLNVYTPNTTNKFPVMVYIHGGGFVFGNGTIKDDQGPDYLVEKGVIVVTLNYRLGIFGFLCLDIPEAQGNMGLKDQVQALKWVQENIASFNGDPTNITIFGISAGAASVDYLLLSPMAKGLFHKAISQSGSALNHWARNLDCKKLALEVAKQLGYQGNDDSSSLYSFIFEQPTEELVKVSFEVIQSVDNKGVYFGFVPVIEKTFENTETFLTNKPYTLFKTGDFNKVPLIRGFCNFEGLLMHAMKPFVVEKCVENKDLAGCLPYDLSDQGEMNKNLLKLFLDAIQPGDGRDTFALKFFSDLDFTSGVWVSGTIISEHSVPLYMYKFAYDGGMNHFKKIFGIMRAGASHGDDIGYIMRLEDMIEYRKDTDKKICDYLATMWSNFAKTGDPNPVENDESTTWLPFTKQEKNFLVIDESLRLKANYEPERMAFFEEIYESFE